MYSALISLLPLLLLWSDVVCALPLAEPLDISFAHLPIKRDAHPHAAPHAARVAQHEAQKRNYARNLIDDDHIAAHDEVMVTAANMGSGLVKRAPSDAHSQPMADWFNGGVDLLYTLPTYVGTPGQGLNVVPDTGSADLWVPWSRSNMVENHETFAPGNSSTFAQTNKTFELTYGLGRAEGIIARDAVKMGGFEVSNMYFGVATEVDRQFQLQANDGIMGFASSRISKYPARTFFENLIVAKAVLEPYFSVYMIRGRDVQSGKEGIVEGSEMCLGCMATPTVGAVSGDIHMVNLTQFAFWQVEQDGIALNGKMIPGTSCEVIMDTGTTLIYLPPAVADAMLAPLGATRLKDGSYIAPVANVRSSTRFSFGYGGQMFEMNPLDLVNAFTDDTRQNFLLSVVASNITGVNNEPLGIMGDAFLKNVISIYHYAYDGSPAVGLQQIVSTSANSTSTGTATATPSAPVAQSSAVPRPSGQIGQTTSAAPIETGAGAGAASAGVATGTFGKAPAKASMAASGQGAPVVQSRAAGLKLGPQTGLGMGLLGALLTMVVAM